MLVLVGFTEPWAVFGRASLRRVTQESHRDGHSVTAPQPFALW